MLSRVGLRVYEFLSTCQNHRPIESYQPKSSTLIVTPFVRIKWRIEKSLNKDPLKNVTLKKDTEKLTVTLIVPRDLQKGTKKRVGKVLKKLLNYSGQRLISFCIILDFLVFVIRESLLSMLRNNKIVLKKTWYTSGNDSLKLTSLYFFRDNFLLYVLPRIVFVSHIIVGLHLNQRSLNTLAQ